MEVDFQVNEFEEVLPSREIRWPVPEFRPSFENLGCDKSDFRRNAGTQGQERYALPPEKIEKMFSKDWAAFETELELASQYASAGDRGEFSWQSTYGNRYAGSRSSRVTRFSGAGIVGLLDSVLIYELAVGSFLARRGPAPAKPEGPAPKGRLLSLFYWDDA